MAAVAVDFEVGAVHRSHCRLKQTDISISKGSKANYGTLELYAFPPHTIVVFGASVDLHIDNSGTIPDSAAGAIAVGTMPLNNEVIGITHASINEVIVVPTRIAGETDIQVSSGETKSLGNFGDNLVARLNVTFKKGSIPANTSIVITGTISFLWAAVTG